MKEPQPEGAGGLSQKEADCERAAKQQAACEFPARQSGVPPRFKKKATNTTAPESVSADRDAVDDLDGDQEDDARLPVDPAGNAAVKPERTPHEAAERRPT